MKVKKSKEQRMSNALISFIQKTMKGFLIGIGIFLAIATAGIFAVAVSGTFNTFSSGNVMKSSDINANFASLKTAIEGIPTQKTMRLIYENDITSAQDSITISGLDGNSDLTYFVFTRMVEATTNPDFYIQFNSDTNTANYGLRAISHWQSGGPSSTALNTNTGMYACGHGSSGGSGINILNFQLYAKSGIRRLASYTCGQYLNNSAWQSSFGYSWWTDTASNITSITLKGNIANSIGAGSHIEVWARR
jgi:hypothetical protein